MFACKETAILHFVALAVAALAFRLQHRPAQSADWRGIFRQILAAIASFLVVIVALFTWFDRSLKSLEALSHVVSNVLSRAAGQGHQQPFWYYGRLLAGGWSGGLLVALACLVLLVAVSRYKASPYQWLAYYGLLLAVIYSAIPYKTPWLALNLWLPMAMFAALAAVFLWRWANDQTGQRIAIPAFCILAAGVAILIAHDTRERVFVLPADERNPYAYAHTSDDILGLPAEIAEIASRNGIKSPRIAVIATDPWPLPWYLRHFQQVGFWQPGQQVADADFYVTSTEAADRYADRLRGFRPDFFGSRPGVLVLLWMPEPK
jgi:predicted membrane-bound mannosyltransferase